MTDKELLEKAAKAAGIEIAWGDNRESSRWCHSTLGIGGWWTAWNPLTDDGDALRLAVKLGLDVTIDTGHEDDPRTQAIGFCNSQSAEVLDAIEYHGDPYAATRRAIVRAAAAIGKAMP